MRILFIFVSLGIAEHLTYGCHSMFLNWNRIDTHLIIFVLYPKAKKSKFNPSSTWLPLNYGFQSLPQNLKHPEDYSQEDSKDNQRHAWHEWLSTPPQCTKNYWDLVTDWERVEKDKWEHNFNMLCHIVKRQELNYYKGYKKCFHLSHWSKTGTCLCRWSK